MRESFKTGFSFGLTSGIITTLGLIVGLHSGTHSQAVVLGGIVTIAIADALSDSLGIHLAEESKNSHPPRAIWESTTATFLAKLFFALSFLIPVLWLGLPQAIGVCVFWGLLLLSIFSFFLAKESQKNPWPIIAEHLLIALVVVGATHLLGDWLSARFSS